MITVTRSHLSISLNSLTPHPPLLPHLPPLSQSLRHTRCSMPSCVAPLKSPSSRVACSSRWNSAAKRKVASLLSKTLSNPASLFQSYATTFPSYKAWFWIVVGILASLTFSTSLIMRSFLSRMTKLVPHIIPSRGRWAKAPLMSSLLLLALAVFYTYQRRAS